MSTSIQPAPDWFERLWEEHAHKLPILLRNDSGKKLARQLVAVVIDSLGQFAKTPEGVRQIVAYARIYSILKGSQGVIDAPNPTPEQVADAVQKLVEKVKP